MRFIENRKGENKLLSNPKHGWCTVEVGDFKGQASYLYDVPFNCLDAFINVFNKNTGVNCASIYFDEEGSWFYLITDTDYTYIIIEREKTEVKCFDVNIIQLANELINDLERNFNDWVDWLCYDEPEKGRVEKLRNKIEQLKQLVEDF